MICRYIINHHVSSRVPDNGVRYFPKAYSQGLFPKCEISQAATSQRLGGRVMQLGWARGPSTAARTAARGPSTAAGTG